MFVIACKPTFIFFTAFGIPKNYLFCPKFEAFCEKRAEN